MQTVTDQEQAPGTRPRVWLGWALVGVLLVSGVVLALRYGTQVTPLLDVPR